MEGKDEDRERKTKKKEKVKHKKKKQPSQKSSPTGVEGVNRIDILPSAQHMSPLVTNTEESISLSKANRLCSFQL